MGRKAREGIWGAEEEIYRRTSISCTGFRIRIEVDASDYVT